MLYNLIGVRERKFWDPLYMFFNIYFTSKEFLKEKYNITIKNEV